MADYDFDLFVIGAGSGGVRASRMAAGFGAKVAVAEDSYLGGTCVNVGCVPKKLFVYGSHFSEDFEAARGFGWNLAKPEFDWPTLRDNKTKEIQRLNGIYANILSNAGVELIEGRASIVDAHTVEVSGKKYSAEKILIAVGGKPFVPDFPGSDLAITSNDAFYLDKLPEKIIIVGGGYIAVEFAGIFNGLGVETHLVYRGPLFLRGFDNEVREFLVGQMRHKGIHLHFNTNITKLESEGGKIKASLTTDKVEEADAVMYATGRVPRFEGLGLENTKVQLSEKGYIEVNDEFQTAEPSIYALGDILGRIELTPVALAEAMVFAKTQYGNQKSTMDYDYVASAVFSQPNIGSVGLTEEQAREKYSDVAIYTSSFKPMKHTLSGMDEKTFMKLIVNKADDRVLGCHMVGPEAGEIMQGIGIAIKAGATKADFDATIGIHPTAAEEFVTMREPVR